MSGLLVPQLVMQRQVGEKRCVACRDFKLKPGTMWLGYTKAGLDDCIPCPACGGTGKEPIYQLVDPLTGREIRQEA